MGECILWTGRTQVRGYGVLSIRGTEVLAHRNAWEQVNGPIPPGKQVDHFECHNRLCVNVEHLEIATGHENQRNRSGANSNSRTGVRNVHMSNGYPMVRVQKEGIVYREFGFKTIEEAAVAASQLRAKLFGKFAGGA